MSHKYQSERDSKLKQTNNNDKSKNYTLSTGSLRGLLEDLLQWGNYHNVLCEKNGLREVRQVV